MSTIDQLDTQLRATNVVKLGMRRGSVATHPAPKPFLGVEAAPLDLRYTCTRLDALCKLEDCWMVPK